MKMLKKKHEIKFNVYRSSFNPSESSGKIINEYSVGDAKVYIVDREGYGYYMVDEPDLDEEELETLNTIFEEVIRMDSADIDDVMMKIRGLSKSGESSDKFVYYVKRDMFGYRRLDVLFRDDEIEEISYTGYNSPVMIIHRKYSEYDWMETNIGFRDSNDINEYIRRLLSQISNRSVTTAHPYLDVISPTGDRISVTYQSEITLPGSTLAVRKFPKEPLTITKLLSFNTLSPLMAAYLWLLLEAKGYMMIVGAMGSGKTTLLSCLTNLINPNWKICTIEDTPEVKTFHKQWLRMKSRVPLYKSEVKPITLVDLVIIALRHRPDYIIVGETRSVEIQALTQAASLGHGCMTTFHGADARSALTRMGAPPLNVGISGQLLIWSIITTRRLHYRGRLIRKIVSVEEIDPYHYGGEPKLIEMFKWNSSNDVFTPPSSKEVVEKSVRLKHVMDYTGWSVDDIVDELDRRSRFLKSLVNRKIFIYSQVVDVIRKWYEDEAEH